MSKVTDITPLIEEKKLQEQREAEKERLIQRDSEKLQILNKIKDINEALAKADTSKFVFETNLDKVRSEAYRASFESIGATEQLNEYIGSLENGVSALEESIERLRRNLEGLKDAYRQE